MGIEVMVKACAGRHTGQDSAEHPGDPFDGIHLIGLVMGAYEDEQPDHADEQYAVDERENAAMGVGGVSSDGLECLFARFALFHVLQ